ncbi:MAG: T9SS type A sorting domain-containing protein [Candidatus Aegiribacteria sp.]|nr:T9SS type A sorting domain-containing protein [Candidatus Aegiribacteria sp.]
MDLDGNDSLEIVVGVYNVNELQAYTCTGESIWTTWVPNLPLGTPAVADIDGDQTLEIIQTSAYPAGAVQIVDAETGTLEWIHSFDGYVVGSSPAIGDLDGDGFYDFVFGCQDYNIYAYTTAPQGIEPQSNLNPVIVSVAPNPFHSSASISFELSEPGWTSVTVYDLSGKIIRTLEDSELVTGQHSIVWDGLRENGEPVSVGLYLCRIQSGDFSETTGLCLLK